VAVEARRGCGYRKLGGLYLVGRGRGIICDRLPIILDVCPTCSAGFKQSRAWTWLNVHSLVGGPHIIDSDCLDCGSVPCGCRFCPLCKEPTKMGEAGLLWIGTKFYQTPHDFEKETFELGISRRIPAVPHALEIGKTWVLLAHPKAVRVDQCQTEDCLHTASVHTETGCKVEGCECETPNFYKPAVFHVFKPTGIEKIVTEEEARDPKIVEDLKKRGITPVAVPANDRDHQGSVHDKAEETD
jgi:hypothetical protein